MIIITWPVFVMINQGCTVPVLKLFPDQIYIYGEAHDYQYNDSEEELFSGNGSE